MADVSTEEMAAWLDEFDSYAEGLGAPLLGVLDTCAVRTGLRHQLRYGEPPKSVRLAQCGSLRLFMEYDTLTETGARLSRFAEQLGVRTNELVRMLNEDWLPYVKVVRLPSGLRQLDPRALAVRERDADDYPAAALAALLSPCVLLTHDRDFAALGVLTSSQGVETIVAAVNLRVGQMHLRGVAMVPAVPAVAVGATAKWAADRYGPVAWFALGGLVAGGIWYYFRQPMERRERIKDLARKIGSTLIDEMTKAQVEVNRAQAQLRVGLVPRPDTRTAMSAVLREMALSSESLSAQQIVDLLDEEARPSVADLRAYLHANDKTMFAEVRRGGFKLGRHCSLREA